MFSCLEAKNRSLMKELISKLFNFHEVNFVFSIDKPIKVKRENPVYLKHIVS